MSLDSSTDVTDKPNIYHGIYMEYAVDSSEEYVFTDKNEAFKVFKARKKARLKSFASKDEAIYFSVHGSDPHTRLNVVGPHPEGSPFRSPKSQHLFEFRKAIEFNNIEFVKKCIRDNPRYLISSGDTPTILQDESRSNALHIAAKRNNAVICRIVLKIIQNTQFLEKIFTPKWNTVDRGSILRDLYLNTPDRYRNETPLHLASTFGSLEAVKVLVLQKECDRFRQNKYGETPFDIACLRASNQAKCHKEAVQRALQAIYFVPVLRSPDKTVQPIIGKPFTPSTRVEMFNDQCNKSEPFLIEAIAGPMCEDDATSFKTKWKKSFKDQLFRNPSHVDPDKGLETVGRHLAEKLKVPWREYWYFLDKFVDLTSKEGLELLENYLNTNITQQSHDENKLKKSGVLGSKYDFIKDLTYPKIASRNLRLHIEKLIMPNAESKEIAATATNIEKCNPASYDLCVTYAARIALSIKKRHLIVLRNEIYDFQTFLYLISSKNKSELVDMNSIHFRLSKMIAIKLTNCSESLAYWLRQKALVDTLEEMALQFSPPYDTFKCICTFVCEMLEGGRKVKERGTGDWITEANITCECYLYIDVDLVEQLDSPYRTSYSSSKGTVKTPERATCSNKGHSIKCDSQETFIETSSDEDFFECETVRANCLCGSFPTKLDSAVLDSISSVKISPVEYPFIYFWKEQCIKYDKITPQILWPSEPKSNRTLTKKKSHHLCFVPALF